MDFLEKDLSVLQVQTPRDCLKLNAFFLQFTS